MINKVLCSTGAFIGKVNGRNHKLIAEYAPQLHCDGFEFMMYSSWYENMDEITEDLIKSSILFPVFHVEKSVGECISRNEDGDTQMALELFKKNCIMAQALSSSKLVLHLWSGIASDRDMEHNIKVFDSLDAIARSYNLLLTIENVVCNKLDPMTHLLELRKHYPDIAFTFDTKMAAFHSQLELLYDKEWEWLWNENRIRHMHINDYGAGYMDWKNLKTLHIGDGHIDFERFFEFIKSKKYENMITVESTTMRADGSVDIEKMNRSLDFIYEKLQ